MDKLVLIVNIEEQLKSLREKKDQFTSSLVFVNTMIATLEEVLKIINPVRK